MRAPLALLTSVALLAVTGGAAASPTFPDAIRADLALSYVPACPICHEDARGGIGTVVRAFGRAMIARGLRAGAPATVATALDKLELDKVDSDGDGITDIEQLKQGRDPNGSSGIDINAPPVEYGCGGLTVARTRDDGGWLLALGVCGVVLSLRRRRIAPLALVPFVLATALSSCNPYEVSYVAPEVCQSGRLWTGGDEDERMNPGMACIQCHSKGEGPRFTVAGTLFATFDEKDRCAGTNGANVFVKGADGNTVKLVPNEVGNFYSELEIQLPFTAWVQTADGRVRKMNAAQSIGDCNLCHMQHPAAPEVPGRIVVP